MAIGSDADGLEIVRRLQLARSARRRRRILQLRVLLHLLVGNLVTRKFMADAEAETVFERKVAAIA